MRIYQFGSIDLLQYTMVQTYHEDITNLLDIDSLLEKFGFKISLAEYTGDNSIIIFAEK